MAEALLGPAVENLIFLAKNEFATICGIKEKTEKLKNTLMLINAVLEDAEEKQMTNHSVKVWLHQVKDAAYVLDDILDECSIHSHRLAGLSCFSPKNIIFRHKVGSRLTEIRRRFDQIAEGKNNLLLQEGVRERQSTELAEWRQTSSIIDQPQVYGRNTYKEKIVEFLLAQAQGSDFLSVYPIVGLGGIGKTTLAQLVYNDKRVSSHFEKKIWVCVSENFSVNNILCSIFESIERKKCDLSNLNVIEESVKELLQGKRYMLVLDDVWNKTQKLEGLTQDKWNKLKSVLSCGSKGSCILVSTRDMDVATIMGTCQALTLAGLSEVDCWLLFKQYAFGPEKEEREDLVTIGKEIVKKCGGLPLAAQALGGLLRTKSEKKEWLEVKESRLWTLTDENSILPALRLSYFHLTPTLKQCFAFCAIFPKDTRLQKEDLIHLWMANGFISSRENLDVEGVGNMIVNELCRKSFFQDIEEDDISGHISFKIHDLVHDLAQSVMGQECMVLENVNTINLPGNTHHISFSSDDEKSFSKGFFKVESLRTFYQLEVGNKNTISVCFAKKCSLRVLRICCVKLPSFQYLNHLRYLELHDGGRHTETLPDSLCSLRKLEILKLHSFSKLICLPEQLSCLQNLRHLVVDDFDSLSRVFPNIGKLCCLRTLNIYIVSLEKGHSLGELHNLKLGGNLSIQGLGNVRSIDEVREANLLGKTDLHGLCLSWNNSGDTKFNTTHAEQVLKGLQPHSKLKVLKIKYYEGLHLPSWIGSLNSLVVLQLFGFDNCVQLPALGKLPCLRKLDIYFIHYLQYIDESYEVKAFPALKELVLGYLPKLERLFKVERRDMFPCLSKLFIDKCPRLVLPCLPSMETLTIFEDNNELLRTISRCSHLTYLHLGGSKDLTVLTSFPEGMLTNLTHLHSLLIWHFPQLKELPYELFHLNALEYLSITDCGALECLPEQGWEGLRSLVYLKFCDCEGLRSLPEGTRHLTSLQILRIERCPALIEWCMEGLTEDNYKLAHVPKIILKSRESDTD
ncbi:putative disease resistance protein RGA1 [Abrus precatorius]|uniref:Disease resistance protein RGA1 n=1 Tax=Abrus precatorius TaxID=3816 RepID=A0A8B8JE47_ABRPR|nr:putative disease resistance protein RGA1 [Abrus precatorius]